MGAKYSFKRHMYYEIKDAIDKNHVGFLLGPRKCGKTICLKQLKDYYKNAVYVDVKSEFNSDEEKRRFISQVVKDIKDVYWLIKKNRIYIFLVG